MGDELDRDAEAATATESDAALEAQEHGAAHEQHTDDEHAQAEEQPQPEAPLTDLEFDAEATPEGAVAESLRTALSEMRGEADRIAGLGTGQEQVEAAEQFAEDAGRLDEQVGSAARAADDDLG